MALTEKQMLAILKRPIAAANKNYDPAWKGGLLGSLVGTSSWPNVRFRPTTDRIAVFNGAFTMKQLEAVNMFLLMKLGPGYLNAK